MRDYLVFRAQPGEEEGWMNEDALSEPNNTTTSELNYDADGDPGVMTNLTPEEYEEYLNEEFEKSHMSNLFFADKIKRRREEEDAKLLEAMKQRHKDDDFMPLLQIARKQKFLQDAKKVQTILEMQEAQEAKRLVEMQEQAQSRVGTRSTSRP